MHRLDNYEEPNSKCHICASGLSLIEHLLYGNRCMFCIENVIPISLVGYLILCYWDWCIYQKVRKLRYKENGKETYLAILGMAGYTDINEVNTVKKKKNLWKQIRKELSIDKLSKVK